MEPTFLQNINYHSFNHVFIIPFTLQSVELEELERSLDEELKKYHMFDESDAEVCYPLSYSQPSYYQESVF